MIPDPPPMSEADRAEFYRRRRSRNRAMLLALFVLIAIFYAVSMIRVGSGGDASRSVSHPAGRATTSPA